MLCGSKEAGEETLLLRRDAGSPCRGGALRKVVADALTCALSHLPRFYFQEKMESVQQKLIPIKLTHQCIDPIEHDMRKIEGNCDQQDGDPAVSLLDLLRDRGIIRIPKNNRVDARQIHQSQAIVICARRGHLVSVAFQEQFALLQLLGIVINAEEIALAAHWNEVISAAAIFLINYAHRSAGKSAVFRSSRNPRHGTCYPLARMLGL